MSEVENSTYVLPSNVEDVEIGEDAAERREAIIQKLASMPAAIAGQGGRPATWRAVLVATRSGLTEDEATDLLMTHYSPRCVPPWERSDIAAMVARASRSVGNTSPTAPSSTKPSRPETDPVVLDRGYRAVLSAFRLATRDEKALVARGFTIEEIQRLGYRTSDGSIDRHHRAIEAARQEIGEDIHDIPGVYASEYGDELSMQVGQLIPVRDVEGRIVGLRVRVERPKKNAKGVTIVKDGKPEITKEYLWVSGRDPKLHPEDARVGAAVHVPLHEATTDTSTVRVTEGEYKADLATLRTGVLTLSVPGVNNWRPVLPVLKALGTRRVLLAYDADSNRNEGVATALIRLAEGLQDEGYEVAIETWHIADGKGIDDVIQAGKVTSVTVAEGSDVDDYLDKLADRHDVRRRKDGPTVSEVIASMPQAGDEGPDAETLDAVATTPAPVDPAAWKSKIISTKRGPKGIGANVEIVLRESPGFRGALAYDSFAQVAVWTRPPPWSRQYAATTGVGAGAHWTDQDDIRLVHVLAGYGIDVSTKAVRDAVDVVSREQTVHPVRDYLTSLTWDGVPRLDTWLVTYCGAKDDEYTRDVSRWWPMRNRTAMDPPARSAAYGHPRSLLEVEIGGRRRLRWRLPPIGQQVA